MSDNTKRWPLELAAFTARGVMEQLRPFCEQIEIVGSIRRQKLDVGDMELLYVPKCSLVPDGLFDQKVEDKADKFVSELIKSGVLAFRPNVNGAVTCGPKNKFLIHVASGIPLDLFATNHKNWWVSLVIRTGGKDTNLALTTGAQRFNKSLNAYGCGVTDRATREVTPATSERHVFELCGVPYKEPHERA